MSGSIESFNFASGPGSTYLANTQYAICFRQRTGYCGLRLDEVNGTGEFILNSNNAAQDVTDGAECHNYTINSNNDYLQVETDNRTNSYSISKLVVRKLYIAWQ